ncbi:hypothetical protein AGDE_04009 [Angomonas deanei]|nr:hypothetical protein AGDE_04009 [Angomonas deanei]|eukprot:EPY39919.1 hypothetical protein AGDE_04009 [Angomonas deanei]
MTTSVEGVGAYKASMLEIVKRIGLENYGLANATMPSRSELEDRMISEAMDFVVEDEKRREESRKAKNIKPIVRKTATTVVESVNELNRADKQCTIYLSFEESLEWKAFLHALPKSERFRATVRRRLSLSLWKAHTQGTCLFCWFSTQMCMCEELERYKKELPNTVLQGKTPVTMLFHSDELMRSTNSGHIAAYLLDSPVRVWGLEEDDDLITHLPGVEEGEGHAVYNVSLYPEKGSPDISHFISNVTETGADARIHLILSDSTWGQALSLNRHIPREVTRVSLDIDETYESLFAHLRKRTRETGVSTLEATTMAVHQCLTAFGHEAEANLFNEVMVGAMKDFVDLKCLMKFTDAPFSKDDDQIDRLEERRDAYRKEMADTRYKRVNERMESDKESRKFLLPPVLNYCYCCDRVIGWHRMPEHVLGKGHRYALRLNPKCVPSEHSKEEVVHNFSRPMRAQKRDSAIDAHDVDE